MRLLYQSNVTFFLLISLDYILITFINFEEVFSSFQLPAALENRMPHVSWLRFDMHILESNILQTGQLHLLPFLSQKPFFFLLPSLQCVFFNFFYRHCCCCNFEIAQTTLQRDTIQLAREWMGVLAILNCAGEPIGSIGIVSYSDGARSKPVHEKPTRQQQQQSD